MSGYNFNLMNGRIGFGIPDFQSINQKGLSRGSPQMFIAKNGPTKDELKELLTPEVFVKFADEL